MVAWLPDAKTVFTGDIVFHNGHPVIWAGPIGNWIRACDLILSWDVETIVPGHGPVGDKAMVAALRDYLTYVQTEATARYEAGVTWDDAAWDIALDTFSHWLDRERIVANVAAVYRELSDGKVSPARPEVQALMGRYRWGWETPHEKTCACGHAH